MSIPLPDEITAALAVLHRIPGVDPGHSLAAVAELASPIVQMAQELHAFMQANGLPLAHQVTDIAAQFGLRITTDPEPGELIKRVLVHQERDEWFVRAYFHLDEELPMAELAKSGNRFAAVYLLPEGDKA